MTTRRQPEKKPSKAEMRDRREYVAGLVRAGNTRTNAIQQAVRNLYVSWEIAERLYKEVVKQITQDFEVDHPDARALQAARLQADLAALREGTPGWRSKRDKEGRVLRNKKGKAYQEPYKKVRWDAVARIEAQLADVLGTNAPIRVKVQAEVQVRTSLAAVIANLEPADKDRLVREAIDLERRAGLLPATMTVRAVADGGSLTPGAETIDTGTASGPVNVLTSTSARTRRRSGPWHERRRPRRGRHTIRRFRLPRCRRGEGSRRSRRGRSGSSGR